MSARHSDPLCSRGELVTYHFSPKYTVQHLSQHQYQTPMPEIVTLTVKSQISPQAPVTIFSMS